MRIIDADRAIDMIDEWLDSVGIVLVGRGLSSYGELIGYRDPREAPYCHCGAKMDLEE